MSYVILYLLFGGEDYRIVIFCNLYYKLNFKYDNIGMLIKFEFLYYIGKFLEKDYGV